MHQQHSLTSQIIALVEQKAGLLLREPHRHMDAERAIATTVTELHLRDVHALFQQLQQRDSNDPVWQTLLQMLTIGETYFFRNQAHFNALRDNILPQMIAHKRELNQRWIRIWSAGCATGEEIYSLAILIRELLPDYQDWLIYLIGTDLNDAYLNQAKQGVYRINSFRTETPENLRAEWFTQQGNTYKLDASIRNMVLFRTLNLVSDSYPTSDATLQSMDIILCQNVTIYFEREVTERIQTRLIDTLGEDGWLILGHSEPLFTKSPHLGLRNFPNAVLFQRQQPVPVLAPISEPEPKRQKPQIHRTLSADNPNWAASPVRPSNTKPLKQVQKSIQVDEICLKARQAADGQQWDEALTLLDKLLQSHPLNEYAHYLRGLIFMEQRNFGKALSALRQALYCNSNFILARYTLGELYTQMGHSAQAVREWKLTQHLLASLAPESLVPHSPDLSVDMLNGLLDMHLRNGGLKA